MGPAKPKIALTLGDVGGIGPEVAAGAAADERVTAAARLAIVGDAAVLRRAFGVRGLALEVIPCGTLAEAFEATSPGHAIGAWNPLGETLEAIPPSRISARAGRAACDWLLAATDAALAGEVDAITTAPLHKEALAAAGVNHPGHTEILAQRCGVTNSAMMLYLSPGSGAVANPAGLGIAHVTLHVGIAEAVRLMTRERIEQTITVLDLFLRRLGNPSPRIAVCALNPHGGEGGLFGDEERRLIAPAVAASPAAAGPFPADTLIRRAVRGEFDGLVAMYHDQGHIPVKLLAFDSAVNVTLGLPIVRTSPTHGTAFDIAWTGQADPSGMIEAILTAARLATV